MKHTFNTLKHFNVGIIKDQIILSLIYKKIFNIDGFIYLTDECLIKSDSVKIVFDLFCIGFYL